MEYEITVEGHIGTRWTSWFDGLTVTHRVGATSSTIRGDLVDQAALHGVLQRLRDLGITLISVVPVEDPARPLPPAPDQEEDRP